MFLLNFDKIDGELDNLDFHQDRDCDLDFDFESSHFPLLKDLPEVEMFGYFDDDDSCFYSVIRINYRK